MPRYNKPRKTWQYSTDFKVKAVELSCQEGIQVQQEGSRGQTSHFIDLHGILT